ncbi:hypothetical protein [Arthrobacter sp. Leaf137]|uniref:hypothetical protein n=1 Tax=Arthrobacter sp. Leaf137 TaxID=1736271 RepID=UPI0006FBB07B|nr:hypothetical protein [Arthrobacter sp. Leaf137]KQQ90786.1 hypothetical protein ASF64_02245 [Arthrobacter sp. Leaf137]
MGITGQGPLKGPGLAEIKPESPAGIRAGLYQLRDYVWQNKYALGTKPSAAAARAGKGRPATWMTGKEPDRREVWLITYLPWPDRRSPTHVQVFVYEVDRTKLPEMGPLPATKSLVLYRRELSKIKLDKFIPFPSPDKQPEMFGLAVEDRVRTEFGQAYKRSNYRGRLPGRKGPDVLWRELGDLFRELADETGDGYWREVADELMQGA